MDSTVKANDDKLHANASVSATVASKGSKRAKKQNQQEEEIEGKDESVAANIKKVCHDNEIFKADGFLDSNRLFDAFKNGLLDVEDFKSALK